MSYDLAFHARPAQPEALGDLFRREPALPLGMLLLLAPHLSLRIEWGAGERGGTSVAEQTKS